MLSIYRNFARQLLNQLLSFQAFSPGPIHFWVQADSKTHRCGVLQMRARGPPAEDDDSLAAHLLRIRDPNTGQPLSDEWLLPQVSVLFWAGFDTTGNTMAWTLYCISQHPEVSYQHVQDDKT